ncbi:flagellar basal-body MS-ring/collar protein FliF [Xanthomonas sp. 4461]|uniref:flagellar basal-body MS-ring/collar protein FliF n=1 Tax=Xanthomonas sp. 4461 TaxID=3035313 RepID=UPI002168C54F|nr:flagellar basal-body MS-ring/collar protein FliF [Xanthomonas sp. 4461]MCS3809897.1 flagellar M-ring protein FliF [Xanthomonas sp. 4461]
MLSSLKTTYSALTPARRVGLLAAVGILLLLTAATIWWVLAPRQALLFGELKQADAAEVSAALDEWKIPHSYTADGSGILVEQAQVHPLRMRLVSAGVPKGGHVGFELFDTNEFGVTEFAQRINYQRALQGEIERTIATIPGVEAVRVHLSIRRPGVFLAEDSQSKASVAVSLVPGAALTAKQVSGIRDLVASAVDGLAPEAVVVVGPTGMQLAAGANEAAGGVQGDLARQLGADYERDIRKILEAQPSTAGASISVNVALNFDKVRTTSERTLVAPGQDHGTLVRRSSSSDRATDAGSGAVLNEQVEYAHGTEKQEITRATGRVERISVAIALRQPLTEVEQQRLQRLVMAAIGGDAARGDVVEIGVGAAALPSRQTVQPTLAARTPERPVAGGGIASTWPASLLIWLLVALALGLIAGLSIGRAVTRARNKRLSREQSEQAAQQIRNWLLGPAHERG